MILAVFFLSIFLFHSSKSLFTVKNPTSDNKTEEASAVKTGAFTSAASSENKPPKTETRQKVRLKESDATVTKEARIDLNSATKEDLMTLPGIGTKTAGRIIEKREELGGFKSVDDLTEVERIGKVKLERLRGLVTVKGGFTKVSDKTP